MKLVVLHFFSVKSFNELNLTKNGSKWPCVLTLAETLSKAKLPKFNQIFRKSKEVYPVGKWSFHHITFTLQEMDQKAFIRVA